MATHGVCSIEGCDKPMVGRTWCVKHYRRWQRHGDPTKTVKAEAGEPLRYLREVVMPYRGDDCLIWPFGKSVQGYGCVNFNGKVWGVHRLACEHRNGPAPHGLEAAHSCGRRVCCNPMHLRWATQKENSDDRVAHETAFQGASHPQARLTEADVLQIRALAGAIPRAELAKRFGMGRSTIGHIINRTRWKI